MRTASNHRLVWLAMTPTSKVIETPVYTYLIPIQSQLTEPFKGSYITTARLDHLFNDISGVHLNSNQSYNLLSLDLGQVTTNHLREFVQHGDLQCNNGYIII